MKKINIYLLCFVLTLYSCVNQKEKFLTDLNSTVDFVLKNQDNLTTKMLDVHSSKILELKNIFPIQKSKMTAKEIQDHIQNDGELNIGREKPHAKADINKALERLADRSEILRVSRGVYKKVPF